jgi:hypothetical protein
MVRSCQRKEEEEEEKPNKKGKKLEKKKKTSIRSSRPSPAAGTFSPCHTSP